MSGEHRSKRVDVSLYAHNRRLHPHHKPQGESSGAHRVAGLDAHALYQKAVNAFSQGLVEESARAIQLALAIAPDDPKLQALDAEVSSEWKRQRAHKLAKQATNDWSVGLIEPAVNKIVEAADLVPDYASIAAQAADYCLLDRASRACGGVC